MLARQDDWRVLPARSMTSLGEIHPFRSTAALDLRCGVGAMAIASHKRSNSDCATANPADRWSKRRSALRFE